LLEDAGVSADGVATNSAGGGKIDGIGVGPHGEPGVDRRRRRRLAKRRNTKLYDAIMRGGTVEVMDYPDEDEVD
jgi:hypothetical protein